MEQWYRLARPIAAIMWRRRWLLVATAWVVCLLGWTGVSLVPDSYESQARLYVDTDAILTPLLRGLTIDTATASQLELMQRTLLSQPNLDRLISITDLNTEVKTPQERQALVLRLGRDIKLTAEARNLFTIRYVNQNPRLARDVVTGLVNIFMERATSSNRGEMENARRYLEILPTGDGGVSRLESERAGIRELEAQIRDTMAKRTALQEQVRITPPQIAARMIGGAVVPADGTSPPSQLIAMEEKLAELRTKYTEQHPDVVAARRVLEALKSAPRSSSNAPGGGPAGNSTLLSNPVYEQIKLRLIEAEGTLASLQGRLEVARKELERMEKLALATPQVEAEYQDLDRGYNVVRKNYEELISRRESSKITSAADTGADKVRMRIIDPPQIANNPVAPNRLLLNSVVLVAGLGAVVALGFLFSQSDRSIPNLARLRELGYPVLGSISMLPEYNKGRKIVFQQAGVAAALLMLVVVYGGVATNHIPIDNIINKARLLL